MSQQVLIVEDQATLARNLARYLNQRGWTVVVAESGIEALRCLRELRPAVMIVDVNLPDCDGLDLYAEVKALLPRTRVFAMSGYATAAQQQRARELGVVAFLVKPFALAALDALVAAPAEATIEVHRNRKTDR